MSALLIAAVEYPNLANSNFIMLNYAKRCGFLRIRTIHQRTPFLGPKLRSTVWSCFEHLQRRPLRIERPLVP